MKFHDREINSVADALKALKVQVGPKEIVWYRGQAKAGWKLVPSLARNAQHLKAENALVKRFMQNATPHLPTPPQNEWEWMFLMQHHRCFTRLLDWTESPLAALYFCVSEKKHQRSDGAVWCLDPVELNRAAKLEFSFTPEIPAFGRDQVLESYLPNRMAGSPSQLNPIAIVGPRNTPRMAAQLGTFTINHLLHTPIEKINPCKHVWRWIILKGAKKSIQAELERLRYTALTLFPELDRVADISKELLP